MLQKMEFYSKSKKEVISPNKPKSANEPGIWAFTFVSLVY